MTTLFAPLRSWLERITPARAAASVAGLVIAWFLGSYWATLAFTRDACLWSRLEARPQREAHVAFVTVGDEDLKKYPARDPGYLDRKLYARLIDRLTELGAKQIVMDFLFDRPTPEGGDADAVLAASIKKSGRVVLARLFQANPQTGAVTLLEPIPALKDAAAGLGFVNIKADPDGVLRRFKLVGKAPGQDAFINHIAMEAVVRARGGKDPERLDEGLLLGGEDPKFVPSAWDGSMPDYASVPEIPRISLVEVLEPGPMAQAHRAYVSGKLVVVGSTSPLLRDRHPYMRNWMTGSQSLEDGAWFIAAVMENIVAGGFLERAPGALIAMVWLALVICAVLMAAWRLTRAAAMAAGLIVLAWLVALSAYGRHVVLDAAGITLSVGALFSCHVLVTQLYGKRRLAKLNAELSVEIARLREFEAASRAGADAPSKDMPAWQDQSFVSRFLPPRYTEYKHLGQGGMGVVYKCYDTETKAYVALKVLSPLVQDNPNAVKRFLIEAKTLEALDHASLVKVIDIAKEPLSYFAMELVEGTPLDELIQEGKGLEPKKAVDITIKVADVLGYVHSKGLVHRDIKPSNIMALKDGGVKLLDFGLVHDEGQTAITKTGDVLGTLKYMAPEQFAGGKCSPATDVYSLAVVLCQLLTGTVPMRLGHFHQPPSEFLAQSALPRPFVDVVSHAMEVDSEARPPDGSELMKKLKEVRPLLDKTRAY